MKKIFRTTVFRLVVVAWFGLYMKRFNADRANIVANFLSEDQIVTTDTTQDSALGEKIDALTAQIQDLTNTIADQPQEPVSNLPTATSPKDIQLYYFNQIEDSKLPVEQQVNTSSILPVQRTIKSSKNLIADTIKVLIQGNLNPQEIEQWFITEFPNAQFKLLDTKLDTMGTLTLTFNEVPGFTTGWSARMLILGKSIEKTALQFPEVKRVVFEPETLFQP